MKKLDKDELNVLVNKLPNTIKCGVEVFNSFFEQLIILYGSLVTVGGLLIRVKGKYHERTEYPMLYLGVLANPASNKAVINYLTLLIQKIIKKYLDESQSAKKEYRRNLKASIREESALPPERPPFRVPKISGNITSAKFVEQLSDNNGIPSLIIEDEIDTIGFSAANNFGSQISPLLRTAYHHGTISVQRKTDNQYLVVETPQLAVILAGTIQQMISFIGDVSNGLNSRFLIITDDDGAVWNDVTPCDSCPDRNDFFKNLGNDIYDFWSYMAERDLQIDLTAEQWKQINEFGTRELSKQEGIYNGQLIPNVKRHANMAFRLAMIITAVRYWEGRKTESIAYCGDDDFSVVLQLMCHSYLCSIDFFYQMIKRRFEVQSDDSLFLDKLTGEFTRKEAVQIGIKLGMKARTLYRWFQDFEKDGKISKTDTGKFRKQDVAILAKGQDEEKLAQ